MVAALGPRRLDVRGRARSGEITVASDQSVVNRTVLRDRTLERRACPRGTEPEGVPGVHVDGADDRSTNLAARGPHDHRMECDVEGPELLVVSDRICHLLDVFREDGELVLAQSGRRSSRHLPLQQQPGGDQVIEEHLVVVRESDPEDGGVDQVPRVPWLNPCPTALLNTNEASLLEQLQAFPDDGATEAELLAQHGFGGQDVTFAKRATEDLVSKLLDEDRRQPLRSLRAFRIERRTHECADRVVTVLHDETAYVLAAT